MRRKSIGSILKAIIKSKRKYLTYISLTLLAACALTLLACAAPVQSQTTASPEPAAAVSLATPTPQPAQTPGDGKVRLNPMDFIDLLYENRWDQEKYLNDVFHVGCENIAGILADHGDSELSKILLENKDAYVTLNIQPDTLYYQGQYESKDGRVDYAAVILNNHRRAFCLIFKNEGEWLLTDYFECGQVETSEHTLTAQTAEHDIFGKQTWLIVPGLIDSGTSITNSNCLWYNLNTGAVELSYTTDMARHWEDTPLQYRLQGGVQIESTTEGGLQFKVQYDCLFGNYDFSIDKSTKGKGVSIPYQEEQTFTWEPGNLFVAKIYGAFAGTNEHEFSVRDFYLKCDDEIYRMRRKGSKAEKEWIGALDLVYDNELNALIYIEAPGAETAAVGRYAGFAAAPRLDFYEINPILTVRPGVTCTIDFPNGHDGAYALTRYDLNTGEGKAIPTKNESFTTVFEEVTYLYTLEYTTSGGSNSYDFLIKTSQAAPDEVIDVKGATKDSLSVDETVIDPLPEDAAIALGLQYIASITGGEIDGLTTNVNTALRNGMEPFPDEWDINYSFHERPGLILNLRMVAQTGNITFFVCFYNGGVGAGSTLSLPYGKPPTGIEGMDMKELALYYYELLPVDDQGELNRVEYKRDVKNSDGTTTTQIYVRFKSDNVFAIDLDQDSKRPVWICMYYK